MPDSVGVSTAIGKWNGRKFKKNRARAISFYAFMRARHAWRPRGVPFQPRGWEKKRGKNVESNAPLQPPPPLARGSVFARGKPGGGEEGESHQPDARRINAIIARSAWRFIDTWPHHFGCPLIGRLIVSLLIPPVWLFVPIYALVTLFFFLLVRFPCTLLCNFVSRWHVLHLSSN